MTTTKIYRGEYEVNHNGQTFAITNAQIHSVEEWDGITSEKWTIYNNTTDEFIAAVGTKGYALRIVARQE